MTFRTSKITCIPPIAVFTTESLGLQSGEVRSIIGTFNDLKFANIFVNYFNVLYKFLIISSTLEEMETD